MALNNEHIIGADEFVARLKELKEYVTKEIPDVVGVLATNHFKRSFQDEGFTDKSLVKWAPRKTKTRLQKKILTGQGGGDHLGDSIDYRVDGTTTTIYTDKVYGKIHNEGGEIQVNAQMKKFFWAKSYEAKENSDLELQEQYKAMALSKKITVVQRKFIGDSEALMQKISEKILKDINNILNGS